MRAQLRPALISLLLLTLITGVFYPLLITAMAQTAFPYQANGSLIVKNNQPIGSALIGQAFDDPKYFWSRPSATSPYPYNAASSAGSNLGPTNPVLLKQIQDRVSVLQTDQPVPVDLVTSSASGLDPHISPAAAYFQVDRVAQARGVDSNVVRQLVDRLVEGRDLGVLGEPRVNVLKLNLALDDLSAQK